MKHIKTVLNTPKPKRPEINVQKGGVFFIEIKSYSARDRILVTALRDISHKDFEEMAAFFDAYNEVETKDGESYRQTLDYEYIAPYLCAKGFISQPNWIHSICFGYEIDINEAYVDNDEYAKQSFDEAYKKIAEIL